MADDLTKDVGRSDDSVYLKTISEIKPVTADEQTKLAQQTSKWIDEGESKLNQREQFGNPTSACCSTADVVAPK